MLCLVVALPCEARPLAEYYRLRARPCRGFPVYANDRTALIVSGVGKVAAAAAVACLQMQLGGAQAHSWLNCGVAGHPTRAIGEGLLAHKITDGANRRSWYPPLLDAPPCATDELITVDRPERSFEDGCAYDMEAAGFYPTACRFSTGELVQCYKVVSDGRSEAGKTLATGRVSRLMEDRLEEIAAVAGRLDRLERALAQVQAPPALEGFCLVRWHFTQTQRHQLAGACRRVQALDLDGEGFRAELDVCRRATDVLEYLHRAVAEAPPRIGR